MAEKEIRESAGRLADEMNFRLLCAAEEYEMLFGTVLWVESVIVTEIVYPKRKRGIFSCLGGVLGRLIKRFLTKHGRWKYGNSGTICRIADGSVDRRAAAGSRGR